MGKRTVPGFVPVWADADKFRPWDGSDQAEAWASMLDFKDRCMIESAAEMLAAGDDADLPGLLLFLWGGLDKEDHAKFVDRHRALIEGRAEELRG